MGAAPQSAWFVVALGAEAMLAVCLAMFYWGGSWFGGHPSVLLAALTLRTSASIDSSRSSMAGDLESPHNSGMILRSSLYWCLLRCSRRCCVFSRAVAFAVAACPSLQASVDKILQALSGTEFFTAGLLRCLQSVDDFLDAG